ncbi:hypothetical protein C5Q96_00590 [Mogibacterium diversum]|uniref:DUF3784 domain-containing protein n=1 Tax=Mogibacterium diversum TaxID=114527 RepID=A0A2S0L2F5_9FIRM|nr:hypothetical protein C5Q96_00590 [Mogibacterium diversum]
MHACLYPEIQYLELEPLGLSNDVTWKKSNKFLGILLVIVGLVSMIAFFTISSDMAEIVFLVLLIASFLISVIYSKFVCAKEKEKH